MSDNKNLQNRGWASMADTLEREMPQKKKRRPIVWFFLAGIAILSIIAYSYQDNTSTATTSFADRNEQMKASEDKPTNAITTPIVQDLPTKNKIEITQEINESQTTSKEAETKETNRVEEIETPIQRQPSKTINRTNTSSTKIVSEITENHARIEKPIEASEVVINSVLVDVAANSTSEISSESVVQEFVVEEEDIVDGTEILEEKQDVSKVVQELDTEIIHTQETGEDNEVKEVLSENTLPKVDNEKVEINDVKEKEKEDIIIEPIIQSKSKNMFFPYLMMEGLYAQDKGNGYALGGGIGYGNDKASLYVESSYGKLDFKTSSSSSRSMADANTVPGGTGGPTNNAGDPEEDNSGIAAERPDYSTLLTNANILDFKLGTRKSMFKYLEVDLGIKYRRYLNISNVESDVFLDGDPIVNMNGAYILENQLQSEGVLASYDIAPELFLNIPLSSHWRIGIGYSHGLKNIINDDPNNTFVSIAKTDFDDSFYNRFFTGKVAYTF